MTAVYWRIEWHQHDILTRPAMSTGWSGVDGKPPTTQIGLSACRSARALVAYWQPWIETVERLALCEPEEDDPRYADWADHDAEIRAKMHRVPTDSSRVLIFTGRRLGADQDGYPLVEPEYVITETTYGRLLKHPCLAWLDGAEADDVPALLRARPCRARRDAPTFIVGGLSVDMPAAVAERWNRGDCSDSDISHMVVHDPDANLYLTGRTALRVAAIRDSLEGSEAERA